MKYSEVEAIVNVVELYASRASNGDEKYFRQHHALWQMLLKNGYSDYEITILVRHVQNAKYPEEDTLAEGVRAELLLYDLRGDR